MSLRKATARPPAACTAPDAPLDSRAVHLPAYSRSTTPPGRDRLVNRTRLQELRVEPLTERRDRALVNHGLTGDDGGDRVAYQLANDPIEASTGLIAA